MAVAIDENVLLFIAGGVFIPVFIFLIKMIIEMGNIKTKIDYIMNQVKGSESSAVKVIEQASDIRVLKLRVDNLERDVDHALKRTSPESLGGRQRRDKDEQNHIRFEDSTREPSRNNQRDLREQ